MLSYGFGMPKTLTASLMAVIQTFYKIAPKGLTHLPGLSLVRQVTMFTMSVKFKVIANSGQYFLFIKGLDKITLIKLFV